MSIILYYSDDQSFLHGTILYNNNISIEQALEEIPTCTAADRSRQRTLLYTLLAWTHFAHQHHIRYWIGYGTLVGYVQRHGLLPHDEDIDLIMMAQDTSQLVELSKLNVSSIYKLKVHPQWYIVGETKRSYFHSEGINFLLPNARFINSEEDLYLNIWPIYDYHPGQPRMDINVTPMLTEYDKNYNWISSPKEWTFPLEECLFSGIKVLCPAEPEKLVANIYGQFSINISSTKCVNGSWVRSNEYKIAKKMMNMKNKSTSTEQSINADTTTIQLNDDDDDDDLIEKALEYIPVCNSDDRPRQRLLLNYLQAWSRLAEQHNISYWLTYGTLVGYVQRRGLLPHDLDVDITMMSDDTPQLIKISQLNFSSKYEIRVQPQWNIVGETNRSYFYEEGIDFIAPNARFINREVGNHIDIFPAYDFNPLYSTNLTKEKQSQNLTVYDPWYNWLSFPKNWTYPLQTCYFSEIKVLCPAEPEKLVAAMYGPTSVTKSDTKCIDDSWVTDD